MYFAQSEDACGVRGRVLRADRTRTRRHICSCLGQSGASGGIKSRDHKSNSAAIEASWKHEGGYPDGLVLRVALLVLVAPHLVSVLWTQFSHFENLNNYLQSLCNTT